MKKYLLILMALIGGMVTTKGYSQEFTYGPTPTYCANPGYVVTENPNLNYSSGEDDSCDEGFYVGVFGGANWVWLQNHYPSYVLLDAKSSIGYDVGGSLGYNFYNGFRIEAEFAYRYNRVKSPENYSFFKVGKEYFKTFSYMGNLLYDFKNSTPITPYIGFGLGVEQSRYHSNNLRTTSFHRFAYQGIVGASYKICDKTQLGLEYKYLKSDQIGDDQSVNLAVRRTF